MSTGADRAVVDRSRRLLLRGRLGAAASPSAPPPLRPPWAAGGERRFTEACTRCGDCIAACPQQVLAKGDGGYPEIRFDTRGCSFCGDCATACRPGALKRVEGRLPWTLAATVGGACLATRRIECRVCGERCDAGAIRFRPVLGGVARPTLDPARCTGCGDCVAPCPTAAISIQAAHAA